MTQCSRSDSPSGSGVVDAPTVGDYATRQAALEAMEESVRLLAPLNEGSVEAVPPEFSTLLGSAGLTLGSVRVSPGPGGVPATVLVPGGAIEPPPSALAKWAAQTSTPMELRAIDVLNGYGALFAPGGFPLEASTKWSRRGAHGANVVRMQQTVHGIPIRGAQFVVHLRDDGAMTYFHGRVVPVASNPPMGPPPTQTMATQVAAEAAPDAEWAEPPLPYWVGASSGALTPVWLVRTARDEGAIATAHWVDAVTGELLESYDEVRHAVARRVYDSEDQKEWDGVLLYEDSPYYCWACPVGDPSCPCEDTGDPEFDRVLGYMEAVYDHWASFGWDSWSGMGSRMVVNLRYLLEHPGDVVAGFWSGYYNDHDAQPMGSDPTNRVYLARGNVTQQFVAHEFGHAFNQATAELAPGGHSGAIDEHLADCFAYLVSEPSDRAMFSDSAYSGWYGARNMQYAALGYNPWAVIGGTTPNGVGIQAGHWREFMTPPSDALDAWMVHSNSGIGNAVCVLLADNDNVPWAGVADAGGIGRELAAEFFHILQRDWLTQQSSYFDYALALVSVAFFHDLFINYPDFTITERTNRAVAAAGLWFPVTEVANSAPFTGRVAATRHDWDSTSKVELVAAYRHSTTNALMLQHSNSGSSSWSSPTTPSCLSGKELVHAPTFTKVDWPGDPVSAYLTVDDGSGGVEFHTADLVDGTLTGCTVAHAVAAVGTADLAAVRIADGRDFVFFTTPNHEIHWFSPNPSGPASTGRVLGSSGLTYSPTVQHARGVAPSARLAVLSSIRGADVELHLAFIDAPLEAASGDWPFLARAMVSDIDAGGDFTWQVDWLQRVLSSGGYDSLQLAGSAHAALGLGASNISLTRRWRPVDSHNPYDPTNRSRVEVAFSVGLGTSIPPYTGYSLATASLVIGAFGQYFANGLIYEPLLDLIEVGEAGEFDERVRGRLVQTQSGKLGYATASGY